MRKHLALSLFAAAFLLAASSAVLAQAPAVEKAPLTVETLWKIKRLGGPEISPTASGRWCRLRPTTFQDKGTTNLWLCRPTAVARRLTTRRLRLQPGLEPRRQVDCLRLRRGEDETTQLYSPSGGEAWRLHQRADRRLGAQVVSPTRNASPSSAVSGPT
jgi:hypothetical protein